ncbi:MAG: hypothetical protein H0Z34_09340 [Brevibacillus sp.]|nr:hypothetical protein [Brevibacillus sp.]
MNTSGAFFGLTSNQRRSSPGSLHADPQGRRQNDVPQRRDAVAAANSLRIRRFAGRLAKPFAGEKPPTLVPGESVETRSAPFGVLFTQDALDIFQIESKVSTEGRPFSE